jgi:hypothetical protein
MKNSNQFKSILIASYLFATCQLLAQQQETSGESGLTPKFGIKGGANFSNMYTNSAGQDEHVKVGVNAGFFLKVPIAKAISIQPELLYSNKGAKETYDNFILGTGEYRFNLNYIEVPVLLVFNLTENFSLSAGGYAAYLISASVKDLKSNGNVSGASDLNADNFHRFDYGLVGGLSIDIQKITLGARYNYGLQNVGQSGSLSGSLTSNSKNSVATLFIGFAF